ncbi:hypothetical protein, partial [Candidatus Amarobacter glycogenicus]|uniref:hypothetical protein n=1 Tax=Candidatus Amarobacter glycogenicus TaxID=3140699 RepID=UPI0031CCC71F
YAGGQGCHPELAAAHTDAHRFELQHRLSSSPEDVRGAQVTGIYTPPGPPDRSKAETQKEGEAWTNRLADQLAENQLGKRADLPNLVYLASESRLLRPLSERFSVQPEPEEYQWLARYEPVASRRGSLQNYLYNLKVVDEARFDEIAAQFNRFLVGKRLNGFDRRTGDLLVEVGTGESHPIEELSSGEKQVLLMLATITGCGRAASCLWTSQTCTCTSPWRRRSSAICAEWSQIKAANSSSPRTCRSCGSYSRTHTPSAWMQREKRRCDERPAGLDH